MPQANYRITDRKGREVEVYITDSQLSNARSGNSITPIAETSRKTGRLISNDDLLHEQELSGDCCNNDNCVDCSGDAHRYHANCRNGCTLTQSFGVRL